ncbi:glycosyltransferase involved in cell wall biosynthesis [Kineothrix alysoides]|uniref:Glycosyltransferase involved in cell wall biosynthesis n=1 Tax=Kineothrix alysoides TaxID=1469948 RepID=A0A4R1R202_9FIRM|nr:glycosyltransferase [Kineothrix alysoides]TCL59386.1 glycosyltransferase involved in cell wall biosynthesis [Kineothrix alysoides]
MLFSIITVCYNSEKTIERTLRSVLEQSVQDFEYIIVDGASSDETLNVIHRYEPLFGDRIRVISESDKGIYDAMNKGIMTASGELIGILNSDDYYEKDTLEQVSAAYEGYEYTIIYGLLRTVADGKEVTVYLKNPDFLEEDMIAHPSCFITKKIYEQYGMYSLDYPYSADYEFMMRIRKQDEIRFQGIYSILSNFTVDGASGSIPAYRDTLKLKRAYKLIGKREYRIKMMKSWIAMRLRTQHKGNSPHGALYVVLIIILAAVLGSMVYVTHLRDGRKSTEQAIAEERFENITMKVQKTTSRYLPGIVCWGDSLTASAGGDILPSGERLKKGIKYPDILRNEIEAGVFGTDVKIGVPEVINMGVGGENTDTILGRNGAVPFVLSSELRMPSFVKSNASDALPVEIHLASQNGDPVAPLRQGNKGMESVSINGIEGIITIEQESYAAADYKYYFTRITYGEAVTIPQGSLIQTQGSVLYTDYIPIIFIGENGGYKDGVELIAQQQAIIKHQEEGIGQERYIIVGSHSGTAEESTEIESLMEKAYGRKYINLREYMVTAGLSDAGLIPTSVDNELMAVGVCPASLRVTAEDVHFNSAGYELIGKLIYKRMDELGYFNEVKDAINSVRSY